MLSPIIQFEPILFVGYIIPYGFLDRSREAHGLFFYYLHARRTWEEFVEHDPLVYEGELDPGFSFRQLFESVARMYGVHPESMAKCWAMVDMQCRALQLPTLPDEERYRFDRPLKLN